MSYIEKYEWKEIDGKFVFTLESKAFTDKNKMLVELSRIITQDCEREILMQTLRKIWNYEHAEHRITLDQLKAALQYVTTYLNSREDPFITSSCTKEFQDHMEHLQFILECEVESMERRKQKSYRIG